MNKFQFDYWNDQLYKWEGGEYRLIPEQQKFITRYSGLGYILDPTQTNHWITFTFYINRIRVFYKRVLPNEEVIYYRKDIKTPPEEGKMMVVEMTEADIIEKVNGKWVMKKRES